MSAVTRDVTGVLLLAGVLPWARYNFTFRGVTYRKDVISVREERVTKALLYTGVLFVLDAIVRRGGGFLFDKCGRFQHNLSSSTSGMLRLCLLWLPFMGWVVSTPLSLSTRCDVGFSQAAQHWSLWRWLATRVFTNTKIVLAEGWRKLSREEVQRWQEQKEPFLIPIHPHGILPLGSIFSGLTWNGGGLESVTASGAMDVPGPEHPGEGLHQKFFPSMQLRCAISSGVFLVPGFFEAYRKLGAIECTKPFMRNCLREGKSLAVFPGGARESRYARPGRYVMNIKSRKGFIRLALEERLHLLPLYTFGDEGIVPQPKNLPAILVRLQEIMLQFFGILLPPFPIGLPRFPPLTTITGTPISLSDLWPESVGGEVSQDAVDTAHARYMDAMKTLFEENKALVPGGHSNAILELV